MKRAPQASAKCDDSGEKENNSLARNETPPKRVLRPKNAAERAARVKNILTLLDEMYPHPTIPLASPQCLGAVGSHHSIGAMHRQARQRSDAGPVPQISNHHRLRQRKSGGAWAGHPVHRILQQQVQIADRRGTQDSRGFRRPGSQDDGGAAHRPRRRAQDGQRRAGRLFTASRPAWWWIRMSSGSRGGWT